MIERFKVVREGLDTTSKLLHLGLRSLGDEGDDTDATGDEAGVFFPQLGVAVRPSLARVEGRVRRTLRALGVIDGDDVVILKLWDKQNTPTELSVTGPSTAGQTGTGVLYGGGDSSEEAFTMTVQELDGTAVTDRAVIDLELNASYQITYQVTASGGSASASAWCRGWYE